MTAAQTRQLSRSPLGIDFSLNLLNYGQLKRLEARHHLFSEGEPGGVLFLVIQGEFRIFRAGNPRQTIAREKSGSILGEVGFLDGKPRTASAQAVRPSQVIRLDVDQFSQLAQANPECMLALLRILAARFRSTMDREQEWIASWQRKEDELERLRKLQDRRLAKTRKALDKDRVRLEKMAQMDALTGTWNRRYLDDFLHAWSAQSAPLSMIVLDIDHFKKINDTHGHQAGDRVLRQLVEVLQRKLSRGERLVRFGGEEFIILLPRLGERGALHKAESFRRAVESEAFGLRDVAAGGVTVSLGLATFPTQVVAVQGLLGRADEALYQAKAGGRNRVVVALQSP